MQVKTYYPNGNIRHELTLNKQGQLHDENEPAYKEYIDNLVSTKLKEEYYFNGKLHNTKGPAFIEYSNSIIKYKKYFIHGTELSETNFSIYQLNDIVGPYGISIEENYYMYTVKYDGDELECKYDQLHFVIKEIMDMIDGENK